MVRPFSELSWIQFEIADQLNRLMSDPEDRPFQSKYEARTTWSLLQSQLLRHLDSDDSNFGDERSRAILESAVACLAYELAGNYSATEERSTGENFAKEALKRLEDYQKGNPGGDGGPRKEFVSAEIALRNTLGCIYCERSDTDAAIPCLRQAEQSYVDYIKKRSALDEADAPWELTRALRWSCDVLKDVEDRISSDEDRWNTFEQLHTYTLYYLAQAYKLVGEFGLAAKYCEETLVRQLKSGQYDPIEWSINTATLSVYFIDKATEKAFIRARRCLTAADVVLAAAKQPEVSEKYSQTVADLDRCWAKYGCALLEASRERLLLDCVPSVSDQENRMDDIQPEDDFPAYVPNLVEKENGIPAAFASNFSEARVIFLMVLRRLTAAESFYTLNDHATDYTELTQDSSRAYKALVFFESDIDRKCKMHKRRIDSLVAVYNELSPTYYLAKRRQLAFELGEIYGDMLSLKIEIADERHDAEPNQHQISKINMLARAGVKYFQEFLKSFEKTGDNESGASKFDPIDVRPIVLAHFYCARLWSKILTSDVREKLINCDTSLKEYRWIVDYVDRVDPESLEQVKSEYDVCKEMVVLLPMKMDRMKTMLI